MPDYANGHKRDRLRRATLLAAALAAGSFIVDSLANLEDREIGDVLGPVLFAVFVLSVLTVVALSIYLLVTKPRDDR